MSFWYSRHEGNVSSPTLDPTDPYGISLVSGFYGPGSWSGWILAVIASAVRIHTNPHAKLDPNTWLFVLGTNWAAVDIFRILWGFSHTQDPSTKAIGSLSAALTLAFWGNIYAAAQLIILVASKANKAPTQRIVTQTLGLVLPSFAQTAVFFSVTNENTILAGVDILTIPFLYMGLEIDVRSRRDTLLGFFCSTFVYSIVVCIALPFFLAVWLHRTQESFRVATQDLARRMRGYKKCCVMALFIFHLCAGFAYIMFSDWTYHKTHESSFLILFLCFFPIMFPMAILATAAYTVHFMFIICGYIVILVVSGFKSWSGACFFMPCAPQSITEWDQAYSLLVGIILLFGVEIVPAITTYRRERRDLVEDLEGRMEEARQRRDSGSSLDITTQGRMAGDVMELHELIGEDPDSPLPWISGKLSYTQLDTEDIEANLAVHIGMGSHHRHDEEHPDRISRKKVMHRSGSTISRPDTYADDAIQDYPAGFSDVGADDDGLPNVTEIPSKRVKPVQNNVMSGALPFGYFYMSAC